MSKQKDSVERLRVRGPATPDTEALRRELGLTRQRLDELDQPDTPLYDFVPDMIDNLHREVFALKAFARTILAVADPLPDKEPKR